MRYLYTAVLLAVWTGLRMKNVKGLRWEHVQRDCSEIHIPGEQMKTHFALSAPVHPELQAHLKKRYLKRWNEGRCENLAELPVIGNIGEIGKGYRQALKRCGLATVTDTYGAVKSVRFHDLRHTFASWVERHCAYAAVRALLGHSQRSMTDRYVHLTMKDLREEIERVPWIFPQEAEEETAEFLEV
jgi:integrase